MYVDLQVFHSLCPLYVIRTAHPWHAVSYIALDTLNPIWNVVKLIYLMNGPHVTRVFQ